MIVNGEVDKPRNSASPLFKGEDGAEGFVDGFEGGVEEVTGVGSAVAAAGGATFASEAEVGVGVAEELVRSEAADEGVVPFVAVERIVADAADDRVAVGAAVELIIAVVTQERVVPRVAVDDVVPFATFERVVPFAAVERFVASTAEGRIVICSAIERDTERGDGDLAGVELVITRVAVDDDLAGEFASGRTPCGVQRGIKHDSVFRRPAVDCQRRDIFERCRRDEVRCASSSDQVIADSQNGHRVVGVECLDTQTERLVLDVDRDWSGLIGG